MGAHNFLPGVEQRQCKQPARQRGVNQAGDVLGSAQGVMVVGRRTVGLSVSARATAGSTARRLHLRQHLCHSCETQSNSSPKGNGLMRNHEVDLQVEQQVVSWTAYLGCMAELVVLL